MTLTYPGAPASLIALWDKRRGPMAFGPGEAWPEDLAGLLVTLVPDPLPPLPAGAGAHATKQHEIAGEFAGKPALFAVHGLIVAHLRKRRAPKGTASLFRRMWTEQSGVLIEGLPTRWLISAAITFGEHGETEGERTLGRELSVLFSLMKLYEFERLFSGHLPDQAFAPSARRKAPLPMGMQPFSLVSGGLDVNLLAPIWARAEGEPVLGPLALALLDRLNGEPGTLFRRLAAMRAARNRQIAQKVAARTRGGGAT